MQKLKRSFTVICLLAALITIPELINGNGKNEMEIEATAASLTTLSNSSSMALEAEAESLYDALALDGDISVKTLVYALKGFKHLQAQGMLGNTNLLSIVDLSQSSKKKRLYIIDVNEKKLLHHTYVAHGRNSGGEYATSFSNSVDSHKSSLGFYVTSQTYQGSHGLSLRVEGMEKGFNDRAKERAIVVHGANYLGDNFLKHSPFSGRSWGCPAVPQAETSRVINMIKGGSCLFIFSPDQKYINTSKILNT